MSHSEIKDPEYNPLPTEDTLYFLPPDSRGEEKDKDIVTIREIWDKNGNHEWSFNDSEFIPADNIKEAANKYAAMLSNFEDKKDE
jgi:hypothetical protein